MLRVLDLFSGIGGFSLGLERAGMRTVAFCEIDPYCRAVLAKHWPGVPIHGDIRELRGEQVGTIDLICGGYPCQPFSVAGKRAGERDDRHLWPEYRRLVEELRPSWVVGENVVGHVNLGLDSVLSDLEELGYAWRPFVIPACAVDAKHRRDRLWIVANALRGRERQGQAVHSSSLDEERHVAPPRERRAPVASETGRDGLVAHPEGNGSRTGLCKTGSFIDRDQPANSSRTLADAISERGCGWNTEREDAEDAREPSGSQGFRFWDAEPAVGRVANGVPSRVDRLRALGNAVVPQIPEIIGRAIMSAEAA